MIIDDNLNTPQGISLSSDDGTYLSVCGVGTCNVYQRNGTLSYSQNPIFTLDTSDFQTNPSKSLLSSDGKYLVTSFWTSKTANVYQRTGPSTFDTNPIFVVPNATDISLSSDGMYLAITTGTRYRANVYQRTGPSTFDPTPIFVTSTGTRRANQVSLSSDGTYLAITSYNTTTKFGTANVYQRTGPSTFDPNPIFVVPGNMDYGKVSLSSDGTYLALIGSYTATGTTANVYQRTGPSTFDSNPIFTVPNATTMSFSSNGNYLAFSSDTSNSVNVYKRTGPSTFNPTPVFIVSNNLVGSSDISMSSDGSYLAVANWEGNTANVYVCPFA